MPLGNAEIEQIGTYVRANLAEWMEDIVGPQLLGRAARVEDELTFQRELIASRFEAMDKRFEAVDKRFEDLHRNMEARFDAVDKRFEAVDKRFEDLHKSMDQRFEDLHRSTDKRFEDMHKRFNGMQWMVGGGVVLLATMMSLFQFLGGAVT